MLFENIEQDLRLAVASMWSGIVPCCASTDTCLAHGLCHYTHSKSGGSGYYVAGCTDPTYNAKNCPRLCTSRAFPDVVWNSTMRLWQCCGADGKAGNLNCENATDERFDAPGPKFIKTYWPRQKGKNANKSGAVAGGVVAAVVVLLVLVTTGLLLWRRRRKNHLQERSKNASGFESLVSRSKSSAGYPAKIWKPSPVELQDNALPMEMDGRNQQEAVELLGTTARRGVMAGMPER
ncbi:hypothetical protein E2P81_ATG03508 [Venturia nashicola]|uniref:Uncharacterized protein n=1 Tax=Venturia nashicola TaxID=86259 RepID=A0A4Z1PBG7_9PEZI|nr:hypothetical protein E6O75_ATG03581 [Venturia nashicola]TLD37833.1 hypothetical protein E2P81_ATG03508 [Venturia nashicola]